MSEFSFNYSSTEEKVAKRKRKRKKYLILCKNVCFWKTEQHLGNKRTHTLKKERKFCVSPTYWLCPVDGSTGLRPSLDLMMEEEMSSKRAEKQGGLIFLKKSTLQTIH